jgi:predicted RecB family endonuclease
MHYLLDDVKVVNREELYRFFEDELERKVVEVLSSKAKTV